MALYVNKVASQILQEIIAKIQNETPIQAVSPGTIARTFAEAFGNQLGDYYRALDFNLAQSVVSSANGIALDRLGELYNVKRNTVTEIAEINRSIGSFYFYIDNPHNEDIVIPTGTSIYTTTNDFVGRQYHYLTTEPTTIRLGRTRAFASIRPAFTDSVFSAGTNTLNIHSFTSPPGVRVRCTNPKPIQPQPGFESDGNYRTRIIKQIRVLNTSSVEAIRFAGLGVSGIRDIKIREAVYGLGSLQVLVIPEERTLSNAKVDEVNTAIQKVRAAGCRVYIKRPDLVPFDVSVAVVAPPQSTDEDRILLRRVENAILRYMNTFLSGDTLIYNRLIEAAMDASEVLTDVQITRYAPNGVEAIRKNWTSQLDEQIVPGRIEVSFAE